MLCFNYIANVIKLMRKSLGDERWDMLGRRTCRDMRGYAGICGTDHLPEIGPAVLPFLAPSPQSTKGGKWERKITSDPKKKNAYFQFKLLIINDINQYFNIHLHLISFIIYNR